MQDEFEDAATEGIQGLPQTELLRRAWVASERLGDEPSEADLEEYGALMGEVERRCTTVQTRLGTLSVDLGEFATDHPGVQVSLIKPDGTGGLVSWTEVGPANAYGDTVHTFSYDGVGEEPATTTTCDPKGRWMGEPMGAAPTMHAGPAIEPRARMAADETGLDTTGSENVRSATRSRLEPKAQEAAPGKGGAENAAWREKNIVIDRMGDDALVMRKLGDGRREFVVAHGYDDETGHWGHGTYYESLASAAADLEGRRISAAGEDVICADFWYRADIESALENAGLPVDAANTDAIIAGLGIDGDYQKGPFYDCLSLEGREMIADAVADRVRELEWEPQPDPSTAPQEADPAIAADSAPFADRVIAALQGAGAVIVDEAELDRCIEAQDWSSLPDKLASLIEGGEGAWIAAVDNTYGEFDITGFDADEIGLEAACAWLRSKEGITAEQAVAQARAAHGDATATPGETRKAGKHGL